MLLMLLLLLLIFGRAKMVRRIVFNLFTLYFLKTNYFILPIVGDLLYFYCVLEMIFLELGRLPEHTTQHGNNKQSHIHTKITTQRKKHWMKHKKTTQLLGT